MVRFKNRWLLVEFIFPSAPSSSSYPTSPPLSQPLPLHAPIFPPGKTPPGLDTKAIYKALRDSVQLNFGDVGAGCVAGSLNVKYYSPTTHITIIRIAREHHALVHASLTLLTHLAGTPVIPRVVHVGGTIKNTQEAAIKYDRALVLSLRGSAWAAQREREEGARWAEKYLRESEEMVGRVE